MPYRITGLNAPLFTTLTGTVKNLVLEDVSISGNSGNTGAIACTANGAARIYNVGILSGSVGGTTNTGGLVGYLDGTARVVNCYSFANDTPGAHARHHNAHSIGVCYEGGLNEKGKAEDTRTPAQKRSMVILLRSLLYDYPDAKILGHCDLPWVNKRCPCFDARTEYQDLLPLVLEQ